MVTAIPIHEGFYDMLFPLWDGAVHLLMFQGAFLCVIRVCFSLVEKEQKSRIVVADFRTMLPFQEGYVIEPCFYCFLIIKPHKKTVFVEISPVSKHPNHIVYHASFLFCCDKCGSCLLHTNLFE
jgi:hypothetical protein